jgi:hypothetical protein
MPMLCGMLYSSITCLFSRAGRRYSKIILSVPRAGELSTEKYFSMGKFSWLSPEIPPATLWPGKTETWVPHPFRVSAE